MDWSRLYAISEEGSSDAIRVNSATALSSRRLVRAEETPCEPIAFNYDEGDIACDLIGTTYSGLYLISNRFLSVLRSHAFTGWASFPVVVHGRGTERLEGYHGFAVTGRCGRVHGSRRLWSEQPPKTKVGLYFDPATWDGNDIFMPQDTMHIIVDERVKRAIEEARLTNMRFARLSDYDFHAVRPPPTEKVDLGRSRNRSRFRGQR